MRRRTTEAYGTTSIITIIMISSGSSGGRRRWAGSKLNYKRNKSSFFAVLAVSLQQTDGSSTAAAPSVTALTHLAIVCEALLMESGVGVVWRELVQDFSIF